MADAQCHRKLVKRHDSRIASAVLEIADVLLREARFLREFLLRQALALPDSLNVSPYQSPHVHASR